MIYKKYDVCAMGTGIIDKFIYVPDEVLESCSYKKGKIYLVDKEAFTRIENVLAPYPSKFFCGGSAANTLVALRAAGGSGFCICSIGNDEYGRLYHTDLLKNSIASNLDFCSPKDEMTNRCIILVTPDGERTLLSFQGAGNKILPSDLHFASLSVSTCLFLEGFIFLAPSTRETVQQAYNHALAKNIKTIFTLSTCLFSSDIKSSLEIMFPSGFDLLFCNEDEAFHFCDTTEKKKVVSKLKQLARKFVVTRGAESVWLYDGSEEFELPCVPSSVVDLAGAGDAFAGGFLYGYTQGWSFKQSGELAMQMAAKVINVPGPRVILPEAAMI